MASPRTTAVSLDPDLWARTKARAEALSTSGSRVSASGLVSVALTRLLDDLDRGLRVPGLPEPEPAAGHLHSGE